MNDKDFMRLAIKKAESSNYPFGACVVRNGKILSCESGKVFVDNDPTAHAEILAIRKACKIYHGKEPANLGGATMYATTQPCPMCMVACYWAGIGKIIYGANLSDWARVSTWARELDPTGRLVKKIIGNKIKMQKGILYEECRALFTR